MEDYTKDQHLLRKRSADVTSVKMVCCVSSSQWPFCIFFLQKEVWGYLDWCHHRLVQQSEYIICPCRASEGTDGPQAILALMLEFQTQTTTRRIFICSGMPRLYVRVPQVPVEPCGR